MNENLNEERLAAHDRLTYQTHVVLRLGQYMLAAGASAFRVQDGMEKLSKAVGIERIHVQITYTTIVVTAWANGTFRTEIVEQRNLGVNAERIDAFNRFVHNLPDRLLVEEAEQTIEKIQKKKLPYSVLISSIASGVACAGFAWLNLGGWVECFAVLIAAGIGQFSRKWFLARHVNHFFVWLMCGFVGTGIYIGVVSAMLAANLIDTTHEAGMVSAVLFLVPGFPLTTGILDLIRQDFAAGIGRSVYVATLLVATGAAVWAVSGIVNWSISEVHPGYSFTGAALFAGRFIATFIAAYGFAMLFNAPVQACFMAGINGAIINSLRLTARDAGLNPIAAVGFAALLAGLIAHLLSHMSRHSRVTLSVPAVVVMIPGVPLYRAMTALSNGQDVTTAMAAMMTLFLTIAAIGVGLATARVLTDRNWLVEELPTIPKIGDESTIPEHLRGD